MRKETVIIILIAIMTIVVVAPVYAPGVIRIDPYSNGGYPNPIMLESPATFNISVTTMRHITYQPHILLVITSNCYQNLVNVTVTWPIGHTKTRLIIHSKTFYPRDFTSASSGKIPPGVKANYEVQSCADHLGVSGHTIYYAYGPFLSKPLTTTPQEFTVAVYSTHIRVLIYAIGNDRNVHMDAEGRECVEYDNNVPSSQPGFVVPEPSTILLAFASFGAFGLYAYKRNK